MNCWQKVPDDRPTFLAIHQDLNKWIQPTETEADGGSKNNETKPLYKNVDCAGSAEYLDVIGWKWNVKFINLPSGGVRVLKQLLFPD